MSKLIWIATPSGSKQVPAIAVLGDFAITEVQLPLRGFTITHRPTGRSVLDHDVELSLAVLHELLDELRAVPRFDFQTAGERTQDIKNAIKRAKAVAK